MPSAISGKRKPAGCRKLLQWRRKEGLTQMQAAVILDLDVATVSKIERGAQPGLERARKIAEGTKNAVPLTAWKGLRGPGRPS